MIDEHVGKFRFRDFVRMLSCFFRSCVMRRSHFPPKKADNVAQQLEPFTALKRAKRELSGHWVCVGFGS